MGKIRQYFIEHGYIVPKPLKNKRETLLKSEWTGKRPPPPIIEVNERYCGVNHGMAMARNIFLIPLWFGLIFVAYWHVNEIVIEWRESEHAARAYIESTKHAYGDDYFQTSNNLNEIKRFQRINKDGVMTFRQYMHDRYFYYVRGVETLIGDIVFALLYAPFIPWLLYVLIRFPRYAPLYFDREKQRVLTWRKGRMLVQRYDELLIHEGFQALVFAIYKLKKNRTLRRVGFSVQPSGSAYHNTSEGYQALLGFIVQFMEHGKEYVWKGPDYKTRPNFYLFEDKKPADAEHQIEELLRLSRDDVGKPPTSLLDGWSYGIKDERVR